MANRHRAEVDASAFGPGCVLRLTTMEAATLEGEYGEAWIPRLLTNLERLSPKAVKDIAELGLYNNKNNKIPADQIDWPAVPLQDLAKICIDAVFLLIYGKTGEELAAERRAEAEKAEAEGKPVFLNDPPTTSPAGQ